MVCSLIVIYFIKTERKIMKDAKNYPRGYRAPISPNFTHLGVCSAKLYGPVITEFCQQAPPFQEPFLLKQASRPILVRGLRQDLRKFFLP